MTRPASSSLQPTNVKRSEQSPIILPVNWLEERLFFLHHCLHIVLFESISDSLRTDGMGVDGIDVICGLDSIIQLPRLNLIDDSPLVQGRELGRTACSDVFLDGFHFLCNPPNSRLANTSFPCYLSAGMTILKEGNDGLMFVRVNGLDGE